MRSVRPLARQYCRVDQVNCLTNKAITPILDVPLLGCACCHKLSLAITQFINEQPGSKSAIDTVSALIAKANHLKTAVTLRGLTDLVAIRANDTRWLSTYQLLKLFFNQRGANADMRGRKATSLTAAGATRVDAHSHQV